MKKNYESLVKQELNIVAKKNIKSSIISIKGNLDELSDIQIKEGNNQLSMSKKAFEVVDLFTQIEIYFLVFLAILIQIIVMYNPKKNINNF